MRGTTVREAHARREAANGRPVSYCVLLFNRQIKEKFYRKKFCYLKLNDQKKMPF